MTTENKKSNLDEFESQANSYVDYMLEYSTGFISGMFKHGIIDSINVEKLHKMFSNPDFYQKEIEDLVQYFYISNADVHQLFEMVEVLPSMNYRIEVLKHNNSTGAQVKKLNKHLKKIKHRRLTRDLIKQNASSGNVVGLWLGQVSSPFPFVFDNTQFAFPIGRNYFGEWTCVLDLSWFNTMIPEQRELYFDMLSVLNIRKKYDEYMEDMVNKQYYTLPYERTFCLGTGKLKRNQAQGTSWGTTGLFDVMHKKKLKDLEQSLANKIINAVAVLTVGSEKNFEKYANAVLPSAVKKKIHLGVKSALEQKQMGGVSVVTIPEYAKIDFEKVDVDGLGGDKFQTVNSDIKASYGISGAMTNGEGTNYAIAKLNLEIFYKRIAVMLEDVEDEVYSKMFNLMLPNTQIDNFCMVYEKEVPLTKAEKVTALKGMTDKGWSIRHYIEELGFNFDEYLAETLYETEQLKLQSIIVPYATSFTANSSDIINNGRPPVSDSEVTNENTVRSRESDN